MLFLTVGADMARPSRTGGKTSEAKARNASPAKGRKTTKTKPRIAPAATRVKRRSVSDPSKDLKEAREQQAATAEILKVIASSPIGRAAGVRGHRGQRRPADRRLFDRGVIGLSAALFILRPSRSINPAEDEALKAPVPAADRGDACLRLRRPARSWQIADTETARLRRRRRLARARGFRSVLYVPLMSKGTSIGVIAVTRGDRAVRRHHVQLLQTFADQAVIAIENVRLFDEVQAKTRDLTESLEQQTATSEVLEVISASTGELEPVFQKMLENATRVCGANFGTMSLYEAGNYHNVALYNVPDASAQQLLVPFRPHPKSGSATVARTLQAVQIEDLRTQPPYLEGHPAVVAISDLAGARTIAIVPMLRENELIGTITIFRQEVRPIHRQADRSGRQLRQAGGDRHREHPAAQGIARTHRRLERVTATADRDRRRAQGDQPFGVRPADCTRRARRIRHAPLRGGSRRVVPARRRSFAVQIKLRPRHRST